MDRAFSPMAGKFIGSCRRFIYAQAQCFFISCCLSGSANGMYVKLVFKRLTRSLSMHRRSVFSFRVFRLTTFHAKRYFFPSFWVTMPGRETSKICTWSLTPGPPISMLISYRLLKQKYIYVAADKMDFVGCQAFLNNIEIGVRGGKQ